MAPECRVRSTVSPPPHHYRPRTAGRPARLYAATDIPAADRSSSSVRPSPYGRRPGQLVFFVVRRLRPRCRVARVVPLLFEARSIRLSRALIFVRRDRRYSFVGFTTRTRPSCVRFELVPPRKSGSVCDFFPFVDDRLLKQQSHCSPGIFCRVYAMSFATTAVVVTVVPAATSAAILL